MTLAELEALEERRMVGVRYQRFNAGLVSTILYNSRPGCTEPLEVWDFIPGYARDPDEAAADKLRQSVRAGMVIAFTQMKGLSVAQVRREASAMIQRMTDAGTPDAEALVREVFEEVTRHNYAE